jgi:hypothetical protein
VVGTRHREANRTLLSNVKWHAVVDRHMCENGECRA